MIDSGTTQAIEPTPSPRRQTVQLVVLISISLAMLGAGMYSAARSRHLIDHPEVQPATPRAPAPVLSAPTGLRAPEAPLRLVYLASGPRVTHARLSQQVTRRAQGKTSAPVETRLELEVLTLPETTRGEAGQLRLKAELRDARVQTLAAGAPIDEVTTSQLAAMMRGGAATITRAASGQPRGFEWTSSNTAQVAPALRLAQDVMTWLVPRQPQAAVRAGEVWTYEIPLSGARLPGAARARGGMTVKAKLLGLEHDGPRTVAVIHQAWTIDGSFHDGAAPDQRLQATLKGGGEGLARVRVATGALVGHDLRLEMTTTITRPNSPEVVQQQVMLVDVDERPK